MEIVFIIFMAIVSCCSVKGFLMLFGFGRSNHIWTSEHSTKRQWKKEKKYNLIKEYFRGMK